MHVLLFRSPRKAENLLQIVFVALRVETNSEISNALISVLGRKLHMSEQVCWTVSFSQSL